MMAICCVTSRSLGDVFVMITRVVNGCVVLGGICDGNNLNLI